MIGDPSIVLDKHRRMALKIDSCLKNEKHSIVVIYGSSGAGKTETSQCLQQELFARGKTSLPISLDDYYLIPPLKRRSWRKNKGIENIGVGEIDWEEIHRICSDFKNKKIIKYRRVHKYCAEIEHGSITSENIDCLIIEGLYGGWLKKLGHGGFFVYLEGTPQQTLNFRQLRAKENPQDKFRKQIVQKEFNVICQLKKHADLIIPFKEDKDEI